MSISDNMIRVVLIFIFIALLVKDTALAENSSQIGETARISMGVSLVIPKKIDYVTSGENLSLTGNFKSKLIISKQEPTETSRTIIGEVNLDRVASSVELDQNNNAIYLISPL